MTNFVAIDTPLSRVSITGAASEVRQALLYRIFRIDLHLFNRFSKDCTLINLCQKRTVELIVSQLSELAMSQCSANIRRRQDWWKYFSDPVVRDEWAEEALERSWSVHTPSMVTEVTLNQKQVGILTVFSETRKLLTTSCHR